MKNNNKNYYLLINTRTSNILSKKKLQLSKKEVSELNRAYKINGSDLEYIKVK